MQVSGVRNVRMASAKKTIASMSKLKEQVH